MRFYDNNRTDVNVNGGIGFFGLLTIVFIALKLMNVIDWSWWLVLLPLYGPCLLFIIAAILFVLIAFLKYLITDYRRKKR